jgi:hypothetical protein
MSNIININNNNPIGALLFAQTILYDGKHEE